MRKTRLLVVVILLSICLGCQVQPAKDFDIQPTQSNANEDSQTSAYDLTKIKNELPENMDDEIKEIFSNLVTRAEEINKILGGDVEYWTPDKQIDIELTGTDQDYYPVKNCRYTSVDQIRIAAKEIYTSEILTSKLNCLAGDRPLYKDVSGQLCININVAPIGNRPLNGNYCTAVVVTNNKDKIVVQMEYYNYFKEENDLYEFIIVRKDNDWLLDCLF